MDYQKYEECEALFNQCVDNIPTTFMRDFIEKNITKIYQRAAYFNTMVKIVKPLYDKIDGEQYPIYTGMYNKDKPELEKINV